MYAGGGGGGGRDLSACLRAAVEEGPRRARGQGFGEKGSPSLQHQPRRAKVSGSAPAPPSLS